MVKFAHGSVSWLAADVATTQYTVTGLGFQPKAVKFYWMGYYTTTDGGSATVALRRGIGFSDGSARRAIGSYSADNSAAADTGTVSTDAAVAITPTGSATVDGALDIVSFDSGGFTLVVDTAAPTDLTIFYEAWGGNDITNVSLGGINEPASTGTVNYTATGFVTSPTNPDQVVMIAGIQGTGALGTAVAGDSGIHIGVATGTASSNQWVLAGNSDDASLTMDTDGYNYTGDIIAKFTEGGGNPNALANLSAFGTDVFTLNWTARATTNRRSIYMAIKGGRWTAGASTIADNTLNATSTISGLAFQPVGVSLAAASKTISTAATATVNDRINLGTASSTSSRRSMALYDVNGQANSTISLYIDYDSALVSTNETGGVASAIDLNAINSDGFQLIVDTAGGVASMWYGYLAYGDFSAAITGTATASITEADVVTGGKTIIITMTGDTFIAAGTGPIGTTANTQALIDGIDSAQAEATGWDAVVKAGIETTDVVRTSNTVATVTLDAEATYNITANETITVTVPAAVLTGGTPIVATPTFTVTAAGGATGTGNLLMLGAGA